MSSTYCRVAHKAPNDASRIGFLSSYYGHVYIRTVHDTHGDRKTASPRNEISGVWIRPILHTPHQCLKLDRLIDHQPIGIRGNCLTIHTVSFEHSNSRRTESLR